MGDSPRRPGRGCGCDIRERAAAMERGQDVLVVADLGPGRYPQGSWEIQEGTVDDPHVWAVHYLVESGWVAREIVHLLLDHGRWRGLGSSVSAGRVRNFVRGIAIGTHLRPERGNVMRRRPDVVQDFLRRIGRGPRILTPDQAPTARR